MDNDLKAEVLEELKKEIQFGFYNSEELLESISEMFYEVEDFDTDWLNREISARLENHKTKSLTWEKPTDFEKLVKAFDELIEVGIVSLHKAGYTRQDGEGDCIEIIDELQALGIKVMGYCYYHTQDLERAIGDEKMLFVGYDSYNHNDELATEVAEKIVKVLNQHGLNARWNGSLNSRIEIQDIDWKKTADTVDYNYERIFEIMKRKTSTQNGKKPKKLSKPFWKFW